MPRLMRAVPAVLLALFVLLCSCSSLAQTHDIEIRVATRLVDPFVTKDGERLTGFSINLWDGIGSKLRAHTSYVIVNTVDDLMAAVRDGRADVGIAAVSITADREQKLDFSQPIFDSGLQVMTRYEKKGGSVLRTVMAHLFSQGVIQLFGVMMLVMLVPAIIIWWVERRHEEGMTRGKKPVHGIAHAIWWAAATLATQADEMPKTLVGRLIAVFWMFTSVVFVAYFTASATTSFTVEQLYGTINGPKDLPGKSVGTLQGSTSAAFLRDLQVSPTLYKSAEDAYKGLENREVDALVYDSPVLLHYAAGEGKGKVQVVGPVFRKENYGIVFPPNSKWRKPVNQALLTLKENGAYQEIYDKWFGQKD